MESQLISSRTQSIDSLDLRSAWHLLSFLLRIGHRASSSEIASRCTVFQSQTHLVEHLCFIPDSPLLLTEDRFVVPSYVAFEALQRFFLEFSLKDRVFGSRRNSDDVLWTYSRRRKRKRFESEFLPIVRRRVSLQPFVGNEDNLTEFMLPEEVRIPSPEEANMTIMKCELHNLNNVIDKTPMSLHLRGRELISGWDYFEHNDNAESLVQDIKANSTEYLPHHAMLFHFLNVEHKPDIGDVMKSDAFIMPHIVELFDLDELVVRNSTSDSAAYGGDSIGSKFSSLKANFDGNACEDTNVGTIEDGTFADVPTGNTFHFAQVEDFGNVIQPVASAQMEILHKSESGSVINNKSSRSIRKKGIVPSQALPSVKKKLKHHSPILEISPPLKENPKQQVVSEQLNKGVASSKKQLSPIDNTLVQLNSKPEKTEQSKNNKEKLDCSKDKRENHTPTTIKEVKPLPKFDSFIAEEEEGSGGYGTVYRAQRKEDGKTFAIKCPHAKANKYHVHNELKMLERFGGKNFVIKNEGSFKIENCEYLVLQHVEHEKPEVLKRDINIFQLQWYGYCMFRALSGLHKQGVVHRDVKPGNFLFSRKFNKGFLIDFNLALDLHHKYGNVDKSTVTSTSRLNKIPFPPTKSILHGKQNLPIGKTPKAMDLDRGKYSKSLASSKYQRKKVGEYKNGGSELDGNNNGLKSQGENGSGLTSTRTPSGERLREPVPVQGRKELLSFVQNTMQTPPNNESSSLSLASSKRKRVSAFPGRADHKKHVYCTPMPLHSHGMAVVGAGLAHKKGDGNFKREGPCVGTKGFRAPEVLLRSTLQGPMLDIWSAGVTLLYFMIGRPPFSGEPEQNIKEIVKFRGSESMWELSKLHDREASFPGELLDAEFLSCMNVEEFCKKNTKRAEFMEYIPESLFDLIDKCLTVNPRMRLSAEEALMHPFFGSCHQMIKKQNQRRLNQQQGKISSSCLNSNTSDIAC